MSAREPHPVEALLPSRLPPGERVLWEGAPTTRALLVHVLHARPIAVYFAAVIVWRTETVYFNEGVRAASIAGAWMLALAATVLGMAALYAWQVARGTRYVITTGRVLMTIGLALTKTVNLPLGSLDGAALRRRAADDGDIAITLGGGAKLAYPQLWPHVRPWRLKQPEPMLRGLRDPNEAAGILSRALAAHASLPVSPLPAAAPAAPAWRPQAQAA